MGYGAVGINGWFLLFANGYSFVGAHTLFLSYLGHLMSFMALFVVDARTLCLALNSI